MIQRASTIYEARLTGNRPVQDEEDTSSMPDADIERVGHTALPELVAQELARLAEMGLGGVSCPAVSERSTPQQHPTPENS